MSKDLRSKIIRLAHSKPELRRHLLPLIQKKSSDDIADLIEFADLWERTPMKIKEAIKDDVFATHGGVVLRAEHLMNSYTKDLSRFSRVFAKWVQGRSRQLK